jgi:hypothetical protein
METMRYQPPTLRYRDRFLEPNDEDPSLDDSPAPQEPEDYDPGPDDDGPCLAEQRRW